MVTTRDSKVGASSAAFLVVDKNSERVKEASYPSRLEARHEPTDK